MPDEASGAGARATGPWARARTRFGLLALIASAAALTLVDPVYPARDQALQHLPTAAALAALAWAARRDALSTGAFVSACAFLALHVLGARWVYSFVPYDAWCRELLGVSVDETLGFRRNHYDRFVHFAYGLLLFAPADELLSRWLHASRGPRLALAAALLLATSALYEVVEWGLAMLLAPDRAERYNGQQGDMWDAQKDMALACLGAVLACAVRALRAPLQASGERLPGR